MLFDAAITTALIGILWLIIYRFRKGALPVSFGHIELRLPGLFILAFALQLGLVPLAMRGVAIAETLFPAAFLLSYLVLLYAGVRNWQLFGMKIAVLGIAMNFLVVAANAGHMPADLSLVRSTGRNDLVEMVEEGKYPRARPLTPNTRLPFLGDVLVIRKPYPRPCVFSMGDIFITVGACWMILATMGLIPQRFSRDKKTIEDGAGA